MSVRTTKTAVGKIIKVKASTDLTPFIETSNALVTEVCVPAGYDDARLELIERWLAAHFYCIFDPRTVQAQVGGTLKTVTNRVDLGFDQSWYGQQAMRLDTKGGLRRLNDTGTTHKFVGLNYVGKTAKEMLDE